MGILFDPAAAQHDLAIVENSTLSRGNGPLRVVETHLDAVAIARARERGGCGGVLVADLDLGPQGSSRSHSGDRNPVYLLGHKARALQIVIVADGDALAVWIGGNHVEGFAGGDAQPLALPHRKMVNALVASERAPAGGHDLARGTLHGNE